jgi:hypothetical protein
VPFSALCLGHLVLGTGQISFVAEFLYSVFSRSVRVKAIRFSLFSVFSLSACQGYSILLWSQLCRPSDSLLLIFISVFFLPATQARLQICFPGQGGAFPPVSTPGAHASYDFCFPPRFGVRRAQMLSTSLVLHAVRTKHRSPWQNFLFLDLVNQF